MDPTNGFEAHDTDDRSAKHDAIAASEAHGFRGVGGIGRDQAPGRRERPPLPHHWAKAIAALTASAIRTVL